MEFLSSHIFRAIFRRGAETLVLEITGKCVSKFLSSLPIDKFLLHCKTLAENSLSSIAPQMKDAMELFKLICNSILSKVPKGSFKDAFSALQKLAQEIASIASTKVKHFFEEVVDVVAVALPLPPVPSPWTAIGKSTADEATEEAGKQVGRATGKKVVGEVVEEMSRFATAKASAKTALKYSLIIDGAIWTLCVGRATYQYCNGDIKEQQFKNEVTKSTCGAGGSIGGSTAGAFVGTLICPVVGTLVGSLAGGVLGDIAGRKAGDYLVPS